MLLLSSKIFKEKFLLALLLIYFSSALTHLSAAAFHAVIVGDLDSKDIAHSIDFDLHNISDELKEISSHTGLPINSALFAGSSARTEAILSHLQQLDLEGDDVMLFYFSGHGYRTFDKESSPWPNLYFESEKKGVDLEQIIDLLIEKPSRLTLIIADCCNNIITEQFAPALQVRKALALNNSVKGGGYQKLFLQSQGFIIAVGCKPEQTSLALANGSLYTLSLLNALHEVVKLPREQVAWELLLDTASQLTASRAKRYHDQQDPLYILLDSGEKR